jgi:large conductance mechanosensitive channel
VIIAAVGLAAALAFSGLVASFTTNIITPLVNAIGGGKNVGLGIHVVPYRNSEARRGHTVFGDPAPTKTCPECLSNDLPAAATRCLHCGTEVPVAA